MNPIRKIRTAKRWTQQQCADRAGCFVSQWGYWERKPKLKELLTVSQMRIAKVFGLNLIGLWMEAHKMSAQGDSDE